MEENSKPLTSVIAAVGPADPVLDRFVQAALGSSVPVELVLVDLGVAPEEAAKLKSLAESDSRVVWLTGHGKTGLAMARNLGAKAAKGQFLLFVDTDCVLPSDAVEKLYAEEARLRPPFMLTARLVDEKGNDIRACRRALLTPKTALIEALHLYGYFPKERLDYKNEPLPTKTSPVPAISGSFMFMRAVDFWDLRGFDEYYFFHVLDMDLCRRFRRNLGEIYFVPHVVVAKFGGVEVESNLAQEIDKAKGFVHYFHETFGHEYPQPFLWVIDAAILGRLGTLLGVAYLKDLMDGKKKAPVQKAAPKKVASAKVAPVKAAKKPEKK
jgi:GT2 family glycosyltransferase